MAIGVQVVFDAANPARQAEFWAFALDYVVQPPPPGFDSWADFAESLGYPRDWDGLSAAVDPEGIGPRLLFQRVPEPKSVKNRVHLDVNASGADARTEAGWAKVEARALELTEHGATVVREVNEPIGHHLLMTDPEGNEFCVQ